MPRHLILCLCLLLGPGLFAASAQASDPPDLRERVQLLHDPAAGEVERRLVRVFDLFPGQNLDFTWEPARENRAPVDPVTHTAEGAGRLLWRVPGVADYDPRGLYAVFSGTLVDGRPDGEGRIEIRSGELYEGGWRDGLRHGAGYLLDTEGNHYEGAFDAGLPHGAGRYTARDGTVYEGPFHRGLRHGDGLIRMPGGTEYAARYDMGSEIESARPDGMADALAGGLLRAQSGEDAGRVTLATTIDQRRAELDTLRYTARPLDDTLAIFPANDQVIAGWNLTAPIQSVGWMTNFAAFYNPGQNNAFLMVELATGDGRTVEIAEVALEVQASRLETKPFLEVFGQFGCIGYRPEFALVNYGWGDLDGATLRYRFVPFGAFDGGTLAGAAQTQVFETEVAGFREFGIVDVGRAVEELGLDTRALRETRYSCTLGEDYDLDRCLDQLKQQADFGPLAPLVGLYESYVAAEIAGELEMRWTASDGSQKTATQPLSAQVSLAWVDGIGLAEMGSGFEEFADTSRYIPVDLPVGRSDYTYPVDYRGQRQVSRASIPLMLRAESASIHDFRVAVRFADGSVRYSQPIRLYYVQPRYDQDWGAITAEPGACFDRNQ